MEGSVGSFFCDECFEKCDELDMYDLTRMIMSGNSECRDIHSPSLGSTMEFVPRGGHKNRLVTHLPRQVGNLEPILPPSKWRERLKVC